MEINIREIEADDIPIIVSAFKESGWQEKPASVFEKYLHEQNDGRRTCFVAFDEKRFAGYCTLNWSSQYSAFAQKNIPEISDLNVLPGFRKKGIGLSLISTCENLAATKSGTIGIGVGLYADYGAAQRLYIKRGYIPDGLGLTYNYGYVEPGAKYPVDDDLILWFTRKIENNNS